VPIARGQILLMRHEALGGGGIAGHSGAADNRRGPNARNTAKFEVGVEGIPEQVNTSMDPMADIAAAVRLLAESGDPAALRVAAALDSWRRSARDLARARAGNGGARKPAHDQAQ
jgi:hypothetical protein